MRLFIARLLACGIALVPEVSLAQIEIEGTLLGADGHPMAMAHLVVMNGPTDTTIVTQVDRRGRFSLTLNQVGGYGMYATGIHHETLTLPLIVTRSEPVELHIRLRASKPPAATDTLFVVTESSEEAYQMLPNADGAYVALVPVSADTLAFRIRYGGPASEWSSDSLEAGTAQDRYAFNRSGPFWDREADYFSVSDVAVGQELEVVFDPSRTVAQTGRPAVGASPPEIALIANIYLDGERAERELGETENIVSYLFAARRVQREIQSQLRMQTIPVVQHWLMLQYYDIASPAFIGGRLAREAIGSIPADSPLWSFEAWSPSGASNLIYWLSKKADRDDLIDGYVRRVIDTHPDPGVRA